MEELKGVKPMGEAVESQGAANATPTPQTPSTSPTAKKSELTDEQVDTVGKIMAKVNTLGFDLKFILPVSVGPLISCYRFLPMHRTKVANLEGLAQDLAITLGADSVLVKRMPGESAVGFFVPNKTRTRIEFRDTMKYVHDWMQQNPTGIPLNMGVDYLSVPFIDDLTELPHILIAGTTGSGKSTLLHSIIASIVYNLNSRAIKFMFSDTKGVEFTPFEDLPHLMYPRALNWHQTMEQLEMMIAEMDRKLQIIGASGQRNIKDYNSTRQHVGKMPYHVIFIDELADVMGGGGKRGQSSYSEEVVGKIVQKARAAGMYVVAATQRPSVDIVAGSIKANFPGRLSFRLPSGTDSRTVLGTPGAEHLLSQGDMLYSSPLRPGLARCHAPYTSVNDIKAIVEVVKMKERS